MHQQNSDTKPVLLKIRDAAKYLNVSERTIHNERKAGHLKAVRIGEKGVRFRIAELERFTESRES